MTRNSKKQKLSIKKKSLRELGEEHLGNARGGIMDTNGSIGDIGDSLAIEPVVPPPSPPKGHSEGGTCLNCGGTRAPLGGTLGRNHNQGLRR